jgi:GAF domain-containing protein
MSQTLTESQRLEVLRQYQILDTPREAAFEVIAQLAAFIFSTPIVLICLMDEKRAWIKSSVGVEQTEIPRELALCNHAMVADEIFYVPDLTKDSRFCHHPMVVNGPGLKFFAGVPLIDKNGIRLGTLSVADHKSRILYPAQLSTLRHFATLVISQIENRITSPTATGPQLSQLMGEFTHDIKNPLTIMLSKTESLLEQQQAGSLDPQRLEQELLKIQKCGERLNKLVTEVQDRYRNQ